MGSVEYLNPPYIVTIKLLDWQRQGLQETATGYGYRLTTRYMLETPDGVRRRVYAICYSNCASLYVKIKKQNVFLRDGELETAVDAAKERRG